MWIYWELAQHENVLDSMVASHLISPNTGEKLIETASQPCRDELLSSLSLWWWKQNRESAFNGWNCSIGIWELIFFSCSAYFSTHCWFVQNERGEAAQFVFCYSNEADHSVKNGTFHFANISAIFSCWGILDRCPTGTSKVD